MLLRRWTLRMVALDPADKMATAWAHAWNQTLAGGADLRFISRREAQRFVDEGAVNDRRLGVRTEPVLVKEMRR